MGRANAGPYRTFEKMNRFINIASAMVCMADAFKFCGDKINIFNPDNVAIGACLYEHRTQLDAECKKAMEAWKPPQQRSPGRPRVGR